MSFVEAVEKFNMNQYTTTANGMPMRFSSGSRCVDYFSKIGSVGKIQDSLDLFIEAVNENPETAFRILQWSRDVRGGAGVRNHFRKVLEFLDTKKIDEQLMMGLINKIPEIGRWDDLLVFKSPSKKEYAFALIRKALAEGNGLAAKWMPRKGPLAFELAKSAGLTPRNWRKYLVSLTKVVEQQMCTKQWGKIDYEGVPSVAMMRYTTAFNRHDTNRFSTYISNALENKNTKINASTLWPHDIISKIVVYDFPHKVEKIQKDALTAQWNALPNYMGKGRILPMVDVSGSMMSGNNPIPIIISISLGLYCAHKNTGAFHNLVLSFSSQSKINKLTGDLTTDIKKIQGIDWGQSTNIEAAFKEILKVAVNAKLPPSDMPEILLILSDMQFDQASGNQTVSRVLYNQYTNAGYKVPKIVYWNLSKTGDTTPVKYDRMGTALVSGFSPAILKAVLSDTLETFSPENIMNETVYKPRYDLFSNASNTYA